MKKIDDLKNDLFIGEIGDRIWDYSNGYICDIISEIADNEIDIYTYNLLEWAKGNYSYIEDAIDELGTPTDSRGRADFIGMIQQGQYIYYTQDLYNNLDDIIKLYIYNYIKYNLGIEEITEEQEEQIDELNYDNNDELDTINEDLNSIFQEEKEN